MTGIDVDVVAEPGQAAERGEEVAGAVACGDGEVGTRRVADEQRVAGEHDRAVDDERAVLGPVARRVQHADAGRADRQLVAVRERLEGVGGLGDRMDRDRKPVLEREAVRGPRRGRRVCASRGPLDAHAVCGGRLEVLLDLERRVDDDGDARGTVADQVRGAAQILVHELPEEEHLGEPRRGPRCLAITIRCTSFVPSPISRIFWSRYRREIGYSSMNP